MAGAEILSNINMGEAIAQNAVVSLELSLCQFFSNQAKGKEHFSSNIFKVFHLIDDGICKKCL